MQTEERFGEPTMRNRSMKHNTALKFAYQNVTISFAKNLSEEYIEDLPQEAREHINAMLKADADEQEATCKREKAPRKKEKVDRKAKNTSQPQLTGEAADSDLDSASV